MKLSEAMMLGSTTCKMEPGDWSSCGLGCAGNALGLAESDGSASFRNPRVQALFLVWPWLRPAEIIFDGVPYETNPYQGGRIASMFDSQVVPGELSFDALVDYVKSVEPSCGECNRFECACKTAAVSEAMERTYEEATL